MGGGWSRLWLWDHEDGIPALALPLFIVLGPADPQPGVPESEVARTLRRFCLCGDKVEVDAPELKLKLDEEDEMEGEEKAE